MKKKKLMRLFAGLLVITMLAPNGIVSVHAEEPVQNEIQQNKSKNSVSVR